MYHYTIEYKLDEKYNLVFKEEYNNIILYEDGKQIIKIKENSIVLNENNYNELIKINNIIIKYIIDLHNYRNNIIKIKEVYNKLRRMIFSKGEFIND